MFLPPLLHYLYSCFSHLCHTKPRSNLHLLATPSESQQRTPEPQDTSTPNPLDYKPIPRAINRLQTLSVEESHPSAERKFTPMDVDVNSRPTSSKGEAGEGEVLNSRGKIVITGDSEGGGYCVPGEDCEANFG
jgi:hypothetical protein